MASAAQSSGDNKLLIGGAIAVVALIVFMVIMGVKFLGSRDPHQKPDPKYAIAPMPTLGPRTQPVTQQPPPLPHHS